VDVVSDTLRRVTPIGGPRPPLVPAASALVSGGTHHPSG